MTDDAKREAQQTADQNTDQTNTTPEQEVQKVERRDAAHARDEQAQIDLENEDTAFSADDEDVAGMFDPAMMAQVEEMMTRLQRVEELEAELADVKGRYARLMADFENYRRRTSQDVIDAQGAGVAKAAEALLPVYDDLTRALEAGKKDPSTILGGVQSVRDVFLRGLERLGLTPTGAEGETFDPKEHEALSVVPGERDGVILQVFQVGFRMGERLVRPARVVVEKAQD